jgi:hypothetical protein
MQTLFAPAIALLNRLGYTKKFTVMGMLALIAIGLLGANLYRSDAAGDRPFAAASWPVLKRSSRSPLWCSTCRSIVGSRQGF